MDAAVYWPADWPKPGSDSSPSAAGKFGTNTAIWRRATTRTPPPPTCRVAELIRDLKRRGLWDETLLVWGGEFGRTPVVQGKNGRDHNPQGFSMVLSGGGVKPGFAYGETDDYGYYALRDRVHMHDLHATILHLLGIDHERLTYRYAGRDFRLTDVHGRVVHEVLA